MYQQFVYETFFVFCISFVSSLTGTKSRGLDSEFNPVKGASMMDLDGEDANLDGGSDMEGDGDGETSSQGTSDKKDDKKDGKKVLERNDLIRQ